ncbi:hypothetical protein GH733_012181 [Mirounga leonina]|nr:hypothetical protein GH733_012181 [Mirounga leonina]
MDVGKKPRHPSPPAPTWAAPSWLQAPLHLLCLPPSPLELRKPSYAEICQRTSREPPSSPLQPPKEQKPNAVGCGKEEKKLTEREPPAPKSNPGPPKDQRRPPGRRPSPPATGKRPHREQSTPPKSPQ